MKYLQNLRFYFVILAIGFIWILNENQKNKIEIKNLDDKVARLEFEKDSLHDDFFVTSIEKNRYEIAFQIFMERNPKAAEQYGTIISEETE